MAANELSSIVPIEGEGTAKSCAQDTLAELVELRAENARLHAAETAYAQAAEALGSVFEGTGAATGRTFLDLLVRKLAEALKVRYAFVGEVLQDNPRRVRTLAVWSAQNFEYDLDGVPSQHVIGGELLYYPSTVAERFPGDTQIAELGVQSYMGAPLFGASGEAIGIVAIMHDEPLTDSVVASRIMTLFALRAGAEVERLRADAELAAREEMYRKAIASADGVVYQLDLRTHKYVHLDDRIVDLLGYSQQELTPDLWSRIGIQNNRRGELAKLSSQEAIERFREGEVPVWSADYQCVARDGRTVWVSDSSIPIRDGQGNVVGCLGILQDITDRKLTEMDLQESVRRFQDLLATIQLVAVLVDTNARVTFANQYLVDLSGRSRRELIGSDWYSLCVPPDDAEQGRIRFAATIETGTVSPHMDRNIVTKSGEQRLISWSNTLLRDHDNAVIGIASIGVDITDRKRLEEELFHAQKMESIGRLAGGVAHDFNNILTAVLGYTDLARARVPADSVVGGHLRSVREAGERAAELTSQLLGFARKQVISPKLLDINVEVAHTEKMLRRLIGDQIELRVELAKCPLCVNADPGQLQQVLVNLAVNARDAMPEGGTLTIATSDSTLSSAAARRIGSIRPGRYVTLVLTDTGMGMSDEVRRNIFEPFYTTKEVGKGTGLGLATCHGIAEQNGGRITVKSVPNRGSTFTVYLPFAACPIGDESLAITELADPRGQREGAEQPGFNASLH